MTFITFRAGEPSDAPARGRELADQLSRAIEGAGFQILEPLHEHEAYGWAFTVEDGRGRPVWCMLQLSDEWLLILHRRSSLLGKLFGSGDDSGDRTLDRAARAALASQPGVTDVLWFRSQEDMREGRAQEP